MKTLIIYMSNHGTTEKVAEKISNLMGYNRCTLVNLRESNVPSLVDFDKVIIGGSVHMGRVQTKITTWCRDNLNMLLAKKVGLFICCMDREHEEEEFERSFPPALIDHAHAKGIFGGELLYDKMNFIEKLVVKGITKEKKTVSRLNQQAINQFTIAMDSLTEAYLQ
jgi:menaquinone-dependent protoporphyrinogen oxidase